MLIVTLIKKETAGGRKTQGDLMKKVLKLGALAIFAFAMLFTVASCSDDDDDGGSSTPASTTPTLETIADVSDFTSGTTELSVTLTNDPELTATNLTYAWYKAADDATAATGGEAISGATSDKYKPTTVGKYYVVVTNTEEGKTPATATSRLVSVTSAEPTTGTLAEANQKETTITMDATGKLSFGGEDAVTNDPAELANAFGSNVTGLNTTITLAANAEGSLNGLVSIDSTNGIKVKSLKWDETPTTAQSALIKVTATATGKVVTDAILEVTVAKSGKMTFALKTAGSVANAPVTTTVVIKKVGSTDAGTYGYIGANTNCLEGSGEGKTPAIAPSTTSTISPSDANALVATIAVGNDTKSYLLVLDTAAETKTAITAETLRDGSSITNTNELFASGAVDTGVFIKKDSNNTEATLAFAENQYTITITVNSVTTSTFTSYDTVRNPALGKLAYAAKASITITTGADGNVTALTLKPKYEPVLIYRVKVGEGENKRDSETKDSCGKGYGKLTVGEDGKVTPAALAEGEKATNGQLAINFNGTSYLLFGPDSNALIKAYHKSEGDNPQEYGGLRDNKDGTPNAGDVYLCAPENNTTNENTLTYKITYRTPKAMLGSGNDDGTGQSTDAYYEVTYDELGSTAIESWAAVSKADKSGTEWKQIATITTDTSKAPGTDGFMSVTLPTK